MHHRRRLIAVILLVIVATGSLARGVEEDRELPSEVVIGFQTIPNGAIVAKHLGWHEETLGVPIRWVQVDSGRDLNTGIAAGSIDLGLGGSSTTVAAIAQGLEAEVFYIYDIIGDNEALVVREESGIREVADLVGKTVAAPFGATTHYHLLAALEVAGVDPDSLRIIDLQPPDLLAAWLRGDIDAGFVWEPTLARMLESGGRVLVSSRTLAEAGYVTGDIGLVRKAFAERYPELVVAYLENQIRAVELVKSDPAAAASAIADEFDIPVSEARRQLDSIILLTGEQQLGAPYLGTSDDPGDLALVFKATGDFLQDQGTIGDSPPTTVYRESINPFYLEEAVRRRGEVR
ncbi:MAG: ABC transporter substrate-binding protein [Spirochaetaceae bacterium]